VSGGSLTDERFWRSYWASKELVRRVDERDQFYELLRDSVSAGHRSFVELGGYPGVYAVLARKHLGLEATLVDLVVDLEPARRLLEANGLAPGDVRIVQADLFELPPEPTYDVVFSTGLAEHFDDPLPILNAHARLAAPGGVVVVTVPNLRGLNGLVQLCFDRPNLRIHNLDVMHRDRLCRAATACGLEQPEAFYHGGLQVWLEHLDERSRLLRELVRGVNAVGRRLPSFDSRATSGHLVLRARKPPAPP
jgi:SAM-dependent methyltransferase